MYARARVCGVRGSGVWPKGLARVLGVPIWACLAQNPNESGTRHERACSGEGTPLSKGTPDPGYPGSVGTHSRAAKRHLMYARARDVEVRGPGCVRKAFQGPFRRAIRKPRYLGYRGPRFRGTHSRAAKRHLMYARARDVGSKGQGHVRMGVPPVPGGPF